MPVTTFAKRKGSEAMMRLVCQRTYASAAVQPKYAQRDRPYLPNPAGLKFSRLSNGSFLVTVDNRSPVARISLVFKAGSRYESVDNRGIVHRFRNMIGLSTHSQTGIAFNYNLASIGGLLSSTATRDHLSINIDVPRKNTAHAIRFLNDLASGPFNIRDRELGFSIQQMKYEAALLKENLPAYAFEKLHKVAYRNHGLAYSLLSPKSSIGTHSVDQMNAFADKYLTASNAVIVATGVDHEECMIAFGEKFELPKGSSSASSAEPKLYRGEIRHPKRGIDAAIVHIAGGAAGLKDTKATFNQAVLANLLGTGPAVKWSNGGQSRLSRAVGKATSHPFFVSATNVGYEDTGLFGFYYSCFHKDSAAVLKAAIGEVRRVANEGVKDEELKGAKNRLKAHVLSFAEYDDHVAEDLAVQASVRRSDLHLPADQLKLVDGVSSADVQQAAKQLISGKFAMSSVGQLENTPYLDDLGL